MTRKHHVVCTAGTSALAPQNFFGAAIKAAWLAQLEEKSAKQHSGAVDADSVAPDPTACKDLQDTSRLKTVEECKQASRLKTIEDYTRISAEFSLVHALQKNRELSSNAHVTLLRTETPDGELAAELSKAALEAKLGVVVTIRTLPKLDVDDRSVMRQGMTATLHAISNELREHDPSGTIFSPVGGYKVMTALAYAVASIHGYASVYLHETGQVLHTIPPLPVAIHPESLQPIASLVRKMLLSDDDLLLELPSDAPEWELIDQFGWFFERVDSLLTLSSLGAYLFDSPEYRHVLWPRVFVAPSLHQQFHTLESTVREEVLRITQKLQHKNSERENSIFHEIGAWRRSVSAGSAQWHLLKRARASERFLWRKEPGTGSIYFGNFWTDHDRYQKEAAAALEQSFDPAAPYFEVTQSLYKLA